jgi:3-oxoacyl-[acyl-carrier-protein] synthase II
VTPGAPDSKRVVITGMGWVTPLGHDLDAVWARLLAGDSAIGPVNRFDAGTFATNFAAEVPPFALEDEIASTEPHRYAQAHVRYALAAAARAWRSAGLGDVSKPGGRTSGYPDLDDRRVGIYLGSGEGELDFDTFASLSLETYDKDARGIDTTRWASLAYERLSPHKEVEVEPNRTIEHIAEAFGARGPSFNCMTACAASTQSVGEAYHMLKRGDADVMIAGGSHTMIHVLGMTGFIRLTAMSTRRDDPRHASRPFDYTRDGFVMGEGAGILILERLDHARKRGATPLAEIAGYGSSADAYRITDIQPNGQGGVVAMRQACEHAGIDPARPGPDGRPPVQYISAHGTGTQENDSIETTAVRTLFGDMAPRVPFSSVKSMMGHLIQAAGAVELITCVQAIRTGWVPPTINLHNPDVRCDLDYVPNRARDMNPLGGVDVAISNGFGFGGQNDSIIVRRFSDAA